MLPTLYHGVNQSRLDYQSIINDNRNSNINQIDTSDSRLNKSRLLDYATYTNEHISNQPTNTKGASNKYDYSHLPHIRHND